MTTKLVVNFDVAYLWHILRNENQEANDLSKVALGYKSVDEEKWQEVKFGRKAIDAIDMNRQEVEIWMKEKEPQDWRHPTIQVLKDPSQCKDRNLAAEVTKYVILDGDFIG